MPHQGVDRYPLMEKNCAGNTAPTILSFTATTVSEGTATLFTVIASDPDNNPVTYSFDFDNDGIYDATGPANTIAYPWGDDHTGFARVSVSDGEAGVQATTYVTVTNADPELTVTDGPVVEGQPLTLSYRITDAGSDDLFLTIDWGDESSVEEIADLLGLSPDADESTDLDPRDVTGSLTHTYPDNAMISAYITVRDDDGGLVTKALTILVLNGEPKITIADFEDGVESAPVHFSATATDPGIDDLTFCWSFDDELSECLRYNNLDGVYPFTATDSGTHVWGDNAAFDVQLTVTDKDGGYTTWSQSVNVANVPPTPSLAFDASSYLEGTPVAAFGDFAEPGTDDVTLQWSWAFGPTRDRTFYNNGMTPDLPKSPAGVAPFSGSDSMTHTYGDNGLFAVSVTACDDDGGCATRTEMVVVENVAPSVGITGPAVGAVYAVGQPVTFTGSFTDPGILDTHMAHWTFDGTSYGATVTEADGSGTVTYAHTFSTPGVYLVTLTVADDDGGIAMSSTVGDLTFFVVIYDPEGGFVTGGGWIDSPAGAYALSPGLTGKATFGFVAKYQTGATVPTGQTEFRFKVANLNFHSTSYEWLVVSGARAQYKGSGTINDAGAYGFLLTLVDGQVTGGGGTDKFRIKIWDKMTGQVVYDNQMGSGDFDPATMAIAGGSIVIHKP